MQLSQAWRRSVCPLLLTPATPAALTALSRSCQPTEPSGAVQVSGAVVKLAEGQGRGEPRVLEIWGAPEQVQAAQNLVQAFLLVGHQQADHHER